MGNVNNGGSIVVGVTVNNQNISNKSSNITISVDLRKANSGGSVTDNSAHGKVWLYYIENNKQTEIATYTFNKYFTIGPGETINAYSNTINVGHASNGTRTIKVYCEFYSPNAFGTLYDSKQLDLPTIHGTASLLGNYNDSGIKIDMASVGGSSSYHSPTSFQPTVYIQIRAGDDVAVKASGRLTIQCTYGTYSKTISVTKTISLASNHTYNLYSGNDFIIPYQTNVNSGTISASYLTGTYLGTLNLSFTITPSMTPVSQPTFNPASSVRFGNDLNLNPVWETNGYYDVCFKLGNTWSQRLIIDSSQGMPSGDIKVPVPVSLASYFTSAPMKLTVRYRAFDLRYPSIGDYDYALVGETTATVTLTAATSMKPSVTDTYADPTGIYSYMGRFVVGRSKITATIVPTLSYNSPITSGSITLRGSVDGTAATSDLEKYSITSSSSQTFAFKKYVPASPEIKIVLKDARGSTYTKTVSNLRFWEYLEPSLNLQAYRCNDSGNADPSGTRIKVIYDVVLDGLDGYDEDKQVLVRYRRTIDSSWTNIINETDEIIVDDISYIENADQSHSYTVELVVKDHFNNITRTITVPSAFVLIDLYGIGTSNLNTGMAIGKVAESANLLDVNFVAEFRKGIRSTNGWINLRDDQGAGYETVFFRNPNYDQCYIRAYNVDENGSIMLIRPGATFVAGGGEYAANRYNAANTQPNPPTADALAAEGAYIGADSSVYIESGANATYTAGRNTWVFGSSGILTTPGNISMPSGSSISGVSAVGGYSLANFVRAYNSSIVNNAYVGASIDQTASNATRVVVRVSTTQSNVDRDFAILAKDGFIALYDYGNEAYKDYYYPNTRYHQAIANSATTSLAAGQITKITMKAGLSGTQSSSFFSIASGGIKVLTAGRYRIGGSVYINSATGQTAKSVHLYAGASTTFTSNTQVNEVLDSGVASGAVSLAPKIVNLNANDIIFIAARSVGAASTASQHEATYLLVEKIT